MTSEGKSAREVAIEVLRVPGYAVHWIPEAAIKYATVVIERESRLSIAAALEPLEKLRPLADWLANEGEKRMGVVTGRRDSAATMRDATQRVGAISQFLQHRSPGTAMFYLAENDGKTAQTVMDNLVLA